MKTTVTHEFHLDGLHKYYSTYFENDQVIGQECSYRFDWYKEWHFEKYLPHQLTRLDSFTAKEYAQVVDGVVEDGN